MKCQHCQTEVEEGARFCPVCGAPLSSDQDVKDPSIPITNPAPDPVFPKKPKKRGVLLAGLVAAVLAIGIGAFFLFQKSESSQMADESKEIQKENTAATISNPEMEALLESGTPWSRLADSLQEDNLSSISFGSGYYSMELADGNKINAQYEFLADPQTEDESSSALVLFKEISSAGDASARAEIIENEGENALVLTFEDDPISSEAAEKLGLSEEVYFYNKESLEKIQSKEKAKQQQQERQQEAQRLKEENGGSSASSDTTAATSSKSASSEQESGDSYLTWSDSSTFMYAPGAGGYHVNLFVGKDGSFTVESTDHDYDQVYYSVAHGKFSQPRILDDNSCEVVVESIAFSPNELPSDLESGLDKGYTNFDITETFPGTLTLYLPDTPVSELIPSVKSGFHLSDTQSTISKFGLTDQNRFHFVEID